MVSARFADSPRPLMADTAKPKNWPWTTIMKRVKFEGSYATGAIRLSGL